MPYQVMSAQAFYAREDDYRYQLDPAWDEEEWGAQIKKEHEMLAGALGQANGGSILDCSCGSGG